MLNLTRQERLVIQFLALFFLIGSGIHIIRNISKSSNVVTFLDEGIEAQEFQNEADRVDSVYFSRQQENPDVSEPNVAELVSRVNLNTATMSELMKLPQVGEVTAQRIIDYRDEHNGFSTVEDLIKVKGIGKKTFERIKQGVSVE